VLLHRSEKEPSISRSERGRGWQLERSHALAFEVRARSRETSQGMSPRRRERREGGCRCSGMKGGRRCHCIGMIGGRGCCRIELAFETQVGRQEKPQHEGGDRGRIGTNAGAGTAATVGPERGRDVAVAVAVG
jgi:hypothetical protein